MCHTTSSLTEAMTKEYVLLSLFVHMESSLFVVGLVGVVSPSHTPSQISLNIKV